MKPHNPDLYHPEAWYIDESGGLHRLQEHAREDVYLVSHGTWCEVFLLDPPDGDEGRGVKDCFVLHSADEQPPFEV